MSEHEEIDCADQLVNTFEYSALESILAEISEKPLHHIHPRAARWREVHVKTRVLLEPTQHLRVLVSCIVINDQVQFQILRGFLVDVFKEFQPFRMRVSLGSLTDYLSIEIGESGEL